MENKINLAAILKDCPRGMELDCSIHTRPVIFNCVKMESDYPIRISSKDGFSHSLTYWGSIYNCEDAKCVIFPKGKTTWEGFVPPCQFKDGDVLYIATGEGDYSLCIVDCIIGDTLYTKASCSYSGHFLHTCEEQVDIEELVVMRFATEEEKQKLFKAIKDNGYKWNADTKTLEKIEPRFKVGNRIRHKEETKWTCVIRRIDDRYWVDEHPTCYTIPFDKQDDYELISNKFDITTLKPFDKVLVRDGDNETWVNAFFGFRDTVTYKVCTFVTGNENWCQCIPYEGNEHLLGTTDDCDEYFKTWE